MRILVTGGAGFIGSHVVERLLARGDAVTVLDDLSAGSLENLGALSGHASLRLHVGSACDEQQVAQLVANADAVIHLAAAVGVRRVVEQTASTIDNNLTATRAVLAAVTRAGTPVLLASSSEVYGGRAEPPFREDDPLTLGATSTPRWAYACAKAMDEWLGLAAFRERRVPVTIARLFNTVGPRQSAAYGMVLPRFARAALQGLPLRVYGDGTQTRCFAHVRDVADALIRLLSTPEAAGQVVNVGSTREVSIGELAERVRARAGGRAPIVLTPYASVFAPDFEDPQRRVPDVTRLRRLIGFVPGTPLDEIIDDVLAHEAARLRPHPRAAEG